MPTQGEETLQEEAGTVRSPRGPRLPDHILFRKWGEGVQVNTPADIHTGRVSYEGACIWNLVGSCH